MKLTGGIIALFCETLSKGHRSALAVIKTHPLFGCFRFKLVTPFETLSGALL